MISEHVWRTRRRWYPIQKSHAHDWYWDSVWFV